MQKNRVNATHFAASTGYGYDDEGRDNLERVYADAFHTEAALVRPQITCGTHALAVALSANLLPGDELLSHRPARPMTRSRRSSASAPRPARSKEYGVTLPAGRSARRTAALTITAIRAGHLGEKTKLITIQRSKGYATAARRFPSQQIGEAHRCSASAVQARRDRCMVDNCYGEFVETVEPSDVGADMIVGSLIKNPGGGLAPIGGYICRHARSASTAAPTVSPRPDWGRRSARTSG